MSIRKYTPLSSYFASIFPGKVQKIAVNAGLSCPNRDGRVGRGGCIFCNNASFNPRYAHSSGGGISEQLEVGIKFFRTKGEAYGYLAYFQAYSNTYGPTDKLIGLYEEALSYPGVVGLVIGTRPDCLEPDLLDYFERRFGNKGEGTDAGKPYLLVELGVESTNDATLRAINRGHDYECARKAAIELAGRGIDVGVHLILGLPGEDREDFILHARRISELPVKVLKLHHLQIVKGTELDQRYTDSPADFHLFSPEEYAETVSEFLSNLREDIIIDRFVSETPSDMVIAPGWGIKPSEFMKLMLG